jgi:hypothetical protein
MFSKYASVVKNLRGVILMDPYVDSSRIVKWLTERFRYRNIGISQMLIGKNPKFFSRWLNGKPFIEIYHPIRETSFLVDVLKDVLGFDDYVCDSIVLSSIYISPLLVVGIELFNQILKVSIDHVELKVRLRVKDWKLHLRIADYTILDMYRRCIEDAEKLWSLNIELSKFIENRSEIVKRDKKRYWRLGGGELSEGVFLAYLDAASLIAKKQLEELSILEVLRKLPIDVAAGLSIVPVINLSCSVYG